jgi:hypothetical protein
LFLAFHIPAKVAALPKDTTKRLLYETGISAQDIRALWCSEEWSACTSQNQQVVFFHDFTQIECGVTLSAAQIDNVFRTEVEQVGQIHCKDGSKGKSPHQPWAIDANPEVAVVDLIRAGYASDSHMTRRDSLNFVE